MVLGGILGIERVLGRENGVLMVGMVIFVFLPSFSSVLTDDLILNEGGVISNTGVEEMEE